MKLFMAICFVVSSYAVATELPSQIDAVIQKHCALGSPAACSMQKCATDPKSCPATSGLSGSDNKVLQEKMGPIMEKCKTDMTCLQNESDRVSREEAEKLKPKCKAGDKDACFMVEYGEAAITFMRSISLKKQ